MSARADKAFEKNSNDVSARADIPSIGKKAAGALNPITKDYGAETSVAVHETIKDAAGKTVTVKAITGIVQQLPRKEERELTQDELTALSRSQHASERPGEAERWGPALRPGRPPQRRDAVGGRTSSPGPGQHQEGARTGRGRDREGSGISQEHRGQGCRASRRLPSAIDVS
ncbi:hypothetical protein [Streptomyces agglomeratus]|uniref:hypothetical protein n=1 Tax=Streptomyces agglomeratus TaxID=285458 RepID=UPI00114CB781|nr:hypothetical protein [Streptomyces agglomeratus]